MTAKDMFELVDVSTDEWGAKADYRRPKREGNDQCFVHHPGADYGDAVDAGDVSAEKAALRKIESYAMRNGWWGIAYDVCVGQSGTIYGGRGLARSGATSGDVDDDGTHNNDEGEAILVLISPNGKMTDACRASLKRLFDAHGGDVIGHRNAGGISTSCPGNDRLEFIKDYRAGTLDNTSSDPSPTPKPQPEPEPTKSTNWTENIVQKLPLLQERSDLSRSSDHDRRAQGLLAAAGVLEIAPNLDGRRFDGKFGPSTKQAVRTFQKQKGLTVDGLIGKNTWTALLGG